MGTFHRCLNPETKPVPKSCGLSLWITLHFSHGCPARAGVFIPFRGKTAEKSFPINRHVLIPFCLPGASVGQLHSGVKIPASNRRHFLGIIPVFFRFSPVVSLKKVNLSPKGPGLNPQREGVPVIKKTGDTTGWIGWTVMLISQYNQ